jgi:predicted permease
MWLYKLLLCIYPASFRAEYGRELQQIFTERRRLISNPLSLVALWMSAIVDVIHNAFLVHLEILGRDLKYTGRILLSSPGFALTAILVTALGIGANTAVFSLVNHVLIRPLPYADADRLVRIWERHLAYSEMEPSPPNYRDWQRMSVSFESMSTYTNVYMNLSGSGTPERLEGVAATFDLLPMLGTKPLIGQIFSREQDRSGATGTILLSYGLWQSKFAGDPKVLGRSIRLDDEAYTIIGVLPSNFYFPTPENQFWIPMRFDADDFDDRNNNYLDVVAKMKNGIRTEQAQAEMTSIAQQLEREYPNENAKIGARVEEFRDGVSRQSRVMLTVLLGASACILVIACTNLANLFLIRAMARRKELTVRAALGAGRERLVRQLLTECLAIALAGGILGLIIAHGCLPLLARLIPVYLPIGQATVLDWRVLGFATALLSITAIGSGVIPSLRICTNSDLSGLREGSRSGIGGKKERIRTALVTAEVTASVILLISSGLLIRALWRIQSIDPGFDTQNVLTLETPLTMPKYESTERRADFYNRVLNEIRAIPDVSNAAYISFLPMLRGGGGIWEVKPAGGVVAEHADLQRASLRFITPGYFKTLKIPIKQGRDVSDSDTNDSQLVAVVSESFANRYWPRQNPIGKRFNFAFHDRTIIGISADIRVRGLERNSEPQVYLPYRQVQDGSLIYYAPKSLVIRASASGDSTIPVVRRIIQQIDPELPITEVQMLQDVIDTQTAPRVTQIRIVGAFALLSVLLAGIGIHGLLGFAVSERTPEIGLRMAMGAQSTDILKMILSKSFRVAITGAVFGLTLAYAAGRAMEAILAGVKPADAVTVLSACALALFTTLSGSLVPAIRAIRVDPASVLRAD